MLLSIAAIEAVTNDGLSTLYGFLGDQWPAECANDLPCTYFKRTSWNRVGRLLKKGRIVKKIEYILGHVKRLTDLDIPDDLRPRLRQIFQTRNRISHMTYLEDPKKYFSVFNDKQVVHTARVAHDTALEYINLLKEAFEKFHLPIETIRPDWWFEEQTSYPSKWSELRKSRPEL